MKSSFNFITKSTSLIISAILFTFAAASCSNINGSTDDGYTISSDAFYIRLINNSDEEIYTLHSEYYLDGKPIGDYATGQNIGEKVIPTAKGDFFESDFTAWNFPENSDLSKFSIEFFVVYQDETEARACEPISLDVAYGNRYYLSLTGNSSYGFAVSVIDDIEEMGGTTL